MKKIPNNTELAVIFQRDRNDTGLTIFLATAVIPGKLDKQKMMFVDWEGNQYSHIVANNTDYGFALRITVGRLNSYYKKKTLSRLCKAYLKDLQLDFYYYTTSDGITFKDLAFISEDSFYHTTYSLKDRDLDRIVSKRLESSYLQQTKKLIDTKQLIQTVENKVIGHDEAIEDIVSILWQNSKSEKKENIMIVGPTGVGKTEIIREIAKSLNIPMIVVDATSLTQTGIVGDSVNDALKRLLYVCNNDVKKAEEGIIVIDEMDKLANSGNSNEMVTTTGVQYELLKLLEDGTYYLNIGDFYQPKMLMFNTSKITVIGLGAFSGMDELKKQNEKKAGFLAPIEPKKKTASITTSDFVQYGLIPELVGRFPNIIELSNLNKEQLIQILKNPNNDILNPKLEILKSAGIDLYIDERVYEKLADNAIKKKTGARGLTGEVSSLFSKAMNEISQNEGLYKELLINVETVENPKAYKLVKKDK